MSSFENGTRQTIFLKIRVKINSNLQNISFNQLKDNIVTIDLISKPFKNKANIELMKLLSKKLNIATNQIQIIRGLKSMNKTIRIIFYEDISKPKVLEKLLN